MENATDALKYAFAIIMFVISISIAFLSISKARETSDIITFALDKTNFYPQYQSVPNGTNYDLKDSNMGGLTAMTVDANGDRIVGVNTVISNLYRYYTEKFCVIINDKDNVRIAKFDVDADAVTNPPWIGSTYNYTVMINAFLSGVVPPNGIDGVKLGFGGTSGTLGPGYWNIAEKSFQSYMNKTFKESFVEVNMSGDVLNAEDGSSIQQTSETVIQKVYITYTATS